METYAANVLFNRHDASVIRQGDCIRVDRLDYVRFKLFLLSLLWRAGISSLPVFRETDLGPHEERLRELLNAGDPGPPEHYGCLLFAVTLQGKPLDGAIYGPQPCRLENHRAYHLFARAFLFVYVVSSHRPVDPITSQFLTADGGISIPVRELADIPFLETLSREIVAALRRPA